jgi:hypothetical protein
LAASNKQLLLLHKFGRNNPDHAVALGLNGSDLMRPTLCKQALEIGPAPANELLERC